ncbi:MAG: class I SAM-dependent rRNA methyltransferase [Candidatus Eremiobacterota bacterium]
MKNEEGKIQEKNIKILVNHNIEKVILSGHPWVFDKSIISQKGDGPPGTLGIVFDRKNRFLAAGLYDPLSPLRLRILQKRKPELINEDFFIERLKKAFSTREFLPSTGTTGYRLINGENDGFPGLVMDRYEDTLVIKIYTCAWIVHFNKILPSLSGLFPHRRLLLRLNRHCMKETDYLHGFYDGQILYGPPLSGAVVFCENHLKFEADLLKGQKTGFFLDQRDNRKKVQELSRDRNILNVFSYTGGFSVYAAKGGAKHVTSLDLSGPALESMERNFALNPELAHIQRDTIQGDAFKELKKLIDKGKKFDMVILDPPSFAKKKEETSDAIKAYKQLNSLGVSLLNRGGILVTCSCSAHVSPEEFRHAVLSTINKSNTSIIEETGHGIDHPVTFKEGRYLKGLFIRS